MNNLMPTQPEAVEEKLTKEQYIALARELSEMGRIDFPKINPESLAELEQSDKDFPGYVTPIGELIERFNTWGMKVVFGPHPESGNVFIVPEICEEKDIDTDSILPRHLEISEGMDERLKKLILANKK